MLFLLRQHFSGGAIIINAQYGNLVIIFVERVELRDFLDAGLAPGSPIVDDYPLASQLGDGSWGRCNRACLPAFSRLVLKTTSHFAKRCKNSV